MRESVHQKRTILSAVKSKYDQVNDFDNFIQSQFILHILYFDSSAKSYYQCWFLSSFHSVHLFIRFSLAYLPYFLFYNISYTNRPFILRIFCFNCRFSSQFQNWKKERTVWKEQLQTYKAVLTGVKGQRKNRQ